MINLKTILVIIDGLGGRHTDYNGKTCLEAAKTPNMDELAELGVTGLLDPIKPGVKPESDKAHLSLFGYDIGRWYTGRGVFEALGIGMNVQRGDICFRTNFATVDDNLIIQDRRAGRIKDDQRELEEALKNLRTSNPEIEVIFKSSVEHRGALIIRGPGLSGEITDVDSHETGVKIAKSKPLTDKKNSRMTAGIVNELVQKSHDILDNLSLNKKRKKEGKLPANILLLRGASRKIRIPSVKERYNVNGIVIAAGALYIGLGKALGLKERKAKGVTGRVDSPIINKGRLAVKELKNDKTDFIFIHMKGADSCGHDQDAEAKIRYIEKADSVFGYLLDNMDLEKIRITLTGDHSTPIAVGDHTSDPTPVLFTGSNIAPDKINEFNEASVSTGGLGRFSGQVVPILLGCNDKLKRLD